MEKSSLSSSRRLRRSDSSNAQSSELKYTGVRKRKWGKYVSEIRLPNSRERIWLGSYDTAEKAARAFDAALFCLRGPNAKFNFPEDPPIIPGRESLSPSEILIIAQQYGNSYCSGGQQPTVARGTEDISPSPNSEWGDGRMDSGAIDWSFLDTLNSSAGSSSNAMDYELFHEPGVDVYMPSPHFASGYVHDDEDDHGNGNVQYYLWNF